MTTSVETRPSSTLAFRVAEAIGTGIKSLIAAALLAIPGLIWFIDELKDANGCNTPLHISHIAFAAGLMVAGAIVLQPPFGKQLTSIFVTVFPNGLPMLGGRRESDPQPVEPENKP